MVVFGSSDFMEWAYDLMTNMSGRQMANWFFGIGIAFDVLLTVLFGWLSWRRLDRMAY